MKSYKFVYVRDIPQLLEVPGNFRAHIQQKHRWTKVSCILEVSFFILTQPNSKLRSPISSIQGLSSSVSLFMLGYPCIPEH
jgi:hypothetical protein